MKQNGSTITLYLFYCNFLVVCLERMRLWRLFNGQNRVWKCIRTVLGICWGISDPDDLSGKNGQIMCCCWHRHVIKIIYGCVCRFFHHFCCWLFQENGNKRKAGKALYYYGRVLQESGNVTGNENFLDAGTFWKTEEYKIMGLLLTDISILNREQSLYDEAINTCRLAIVLLSGKIHWGCLYLSDDGKFFF